jgi:hypothetical protein
VRHHSYEGSYHRGCCLDCGQASEREQRGSPGRSLSRGLLQRHRVEIVE